MTSFPVFQRYQKLVIAKIKLLIHYPQIQHKNPNNFQSYQKGMKKVPKYSEKFCKVLKGSERFQKVPKGSERF